MRIYFKGRLKYPTAFALARNLGVYVGRGWNDIDASKARELLRVYPKAFEAEKPKPKPASFFSSKPAANDKDKE